MLHALDNGTQQFFGRGDFERGVNQGSHCEQCPTGVQQRLVELESFRVVQAEPTTGCLALTGIALGQHVGDDPMLEQGTLHYGLQPADGHDNYAGLVGRRHVKMILNTAYLESLVGGDDVNTDGVVSVYQKAISAAGQERIMTWAMEMAGDSIGGIGESGWLAFVGRASNLSHAEGLDLFDHCADEGSLVKPSTAATVALLFCALASREATAYW